jgi:hypothetical protein
MLDGWKDSKGVTEEIKIAKEWGIPVRYLDPDPGPGEIISWIKEEKDVH